jgi:hypothetical protein
VVAICRLAHDGASHLHASQNANPVCPLCQIVRSGSVRPAVLSVFQKPHRETLYRLTIWEAEYSLSLPQMLGARSPPLS